MLMLVGSSMAHLFSALETATFHQYHLKNLYSIVLLTLLISYVDHGYGLKLETKS